ncbi:DUF4962 domain-containing protein [Paraferrimonas sp. SM1919]|uniref:DUF4962 domain-containing protein n=1 Tax=Paraferrimonas sp. SM1919 TaxID=2662263 RepID=UPI0013D2F1DD|nr:DUF4962 domain-containing protein [Paraferrimonas sp. SM1919]
MNLYKTPSIFLILLCSLPVSGLQYSKEELSWLKNKANVSQLSESELQINKEVLIEEKSTLAFPVGHKVQLKSPTLRYFDPHRGKASKDHYFRLSKSPDFSSAIESGPLKWAMFNPHQALRQGKWYWQYGHSSPQSATIHWLEVYDFTIDGNEYDFVAPAFSQWKGKLSNLRPRYLIDDFDLKSHINKIDYNYRTFLRKNVNLDPLPENIYFDDEVELAKRKNNLTERQFSLYLGKKSKEKFSKIATNYVNILKAYIMTGDQAYAAHALQQLQDIMVGMNKAKKAGITNDFFSGSYYFLLAQAYDTLYHYLKPPARRFLEGMLVKNQQQEFQHMLGSSEYQVGSSHFWQHHFRNFFATALILYGEVEEAEQWLQYSYQLMIQGWPANTRNYDGGWVPGNTYFGANTDTLFLMPAWLTKLTGYDFFKLPWYRNLGKYLVTTSPVKHHANGPYGDAGNMRSGNAMRPLAKALQWLIDDPYYQLLHSSVWAGINNKPLSAQYEARKQLDWFVLPYLQKQSARFNQQQLQWPKSALFEDTGVVVMHSNLADPSNNTMVSMKSSPYGDIGHAQASQNAFNLSLNGKPLFYRTGYYTSWADPHSLADYVHSRAHNTILVDGKGQAMSSSGYGWQARYLDGEKISYALGDASNAYNGQMLAQAYRNEMEKIGLSTAGFDKPSAVTRFRRHLVFLPPHTLIIYDELEAKEPVQWSLLLNAPEGEMTAADNSIILKTPEGAAVAYNFSSHSADVKVHNNWVNPPTDWKGNLTKYWRGQHSRINTPPAQWHGSFNSEKVTANRFLTVININEQLSQLIPIQLLSPAQDIEIRIADWQLKAGMDTTEPAFLSITHVNEKTGLSYHQADSEFTLSPTNFSAPKGSTILVEDGQARYAVDSLPNLVRYQ